MAGNTVKDMTTNFRKLDKFEGHDFMRWQKKMHFLLTTLKVVYVLTTSMLELLEDATVEAIRIRAKWENDDYICMGHILNEDSSSKKFLVSNFNNYKMVDSRPVMEQYNELLKILGQYTQHRLKMDKSISVLSIIDKLPPSWKDFKHTLKHGKDDLSLVQLGSHLCIEESLRAQDSDKGKCKEVGGPSVNMTEEGGKNKHHKQNKGKKGSNENNNGSSSNKKPKLECWKCGKTGHFKRDCRSDSGAITHVCKDRCWFKTFEPVEDRSVLYIGDEHFAPVHGKESVALKFSSGKTVTLFNVLYVPKLRKNLVSGPVLNKCGYKQVYESDKHILSKCGVFVGIDYYNNGIIHETTTPYTPQQNSVAERKNRALKEMVNSMLSYLGLSEGFWEEAMLTACYLLNRVPNKRNKATPYELWQPDPKRKTLGEKGIDCIFVGYAEHSKAYRFYVIEPKNSIIEARDAIFVENYFSSIPRPKEIIPNVQESQIDDHTDDVPSEIPEPQKGNEHKVCKLVKSMYGLKQTPKQWHQKFDEVVLSVDKTKKFLSSRFLMKDMGEADVILEKLNPNTWKPVDQLKYPRAIGCLMYAMTSTRPDIAYTVSRLSRFTSNPSRQHWKAITKVFKYLRDSSSTSGWVFLLGGGAISLASKKQTYITSSNIKSEFLALAAVGKKAEWLRNLIHEIPIWPKPIAPITIRCDSAPTMARVYSQIYNGKSRHLDVRHSMVRELIKNGVISTEFVRTQHNLADHLTKGLARDLGNSGTKLEDSVRTKRRRGTKSKEVVDYILQVKIKLLIKKHKDSEAKHQV
nr:zinc finger, CCHC-type [Tanacetum cinerariifolium]